tara:strand:- start:413 stop:622 length:210 start_codon:yes stop_codon:yes gene_type:complete
MSTKSTVIVSYLGIPDRSFVGDGIKFNPKGIEILDKGKVIGYAGEVRGKMPTHAYIVKPKKWKLKFIKE